MVPSSEELKDEAGMKTFLARAMAEPTMLANHPDERQRFVLANYQYQTSKEKANRTLVAHSLNPAGITNALVKIKTGSLIESKEFKEPTKEVYAAYLAANGQKKASQWFMALDNNESRLAYCMTSDFVNVDIAALENIMEVAASVDDKDLANKASDLLTLALKKKNGENLSTFTFFPGPHSVTLEASI